MYCSAQYFAIPYGDSGSGSTSSREGIGASRPYRAPPEDANRTRAPDARTASSRLTVPRMLTWASSAGAVTEARTSICAARWQISSGRNAVTAEVSAAASVMLSLCSGTWESSRPARPDDRSSSTATSSPPVTSTRIGDDPKRKKRVAVVASCRRAAHRRTGQPTRARWAAGRSAQLNDLPVGRQRDLTVERHLARLRQGPRPVVPGHQVGQHKPSHTGRGRVFHRLAGGQ